MADNPPNHPSNHPSNTTTTTTTTTTTPDPTRASCRSSSRASSSSRRSQQARAALRARSQKRHSASSNHAATTTAAAATDLTSFPSLSPDRSPEGFSGQPALNRALTNTLLDEDHDDARSDISRGRRMALSKLTSPEPHASTGRAALFGDSVLTHDFPGALHLADDSHIDRLIANTGAVKLVRQFARDLALRDAEVSALRHRADARERELKRMLREVAVSNQDIERRLYALENNQSDERRSVRDGHSAATAGQSTGGRAAGLGDLMEQAMQDDVGSSCVHDELDLDDPSDWQSTVRVRPGAASKSGASSIISASNNNDDNNNSTNNNNNNNNRKRQFSRPWSEYILGSNSKASSVMGGVGEVGEEEEDERPTEFPRFPNNNETIKPRKGLDEQLFQPPDAREGSDKRSGDSNGHDSSNANSRRPGRSLSTWAKLFGGNNSQTDKNTRASSESRRRGDSPSTGTEPDNRNKTISTTSRRDQSAVAALKRLNSSSGGGGGGVSSLSGKGKRNTTSNVSISSRASSQGGRRGAAGSVSQGGSNNPENNPGASSTSLGPVEMDAILPMEFRPPTLSQSYNNNQQPGDLLTDRFGFIYDQRRKKREREAAAVNSSKRINGTETLSNFRNEASEEGDGDDDDDDDNDESRKQSQSASRTQKAKSSSAATARPNFEDTSEISGSGLKKWQDYLRIATRPTELLSHTPSAGPIVSLTTGEDAPSSSSSSSRGPSVAVDKGGSLSVQSNTQPSATTSTVIADRPEFAGGSGEDSTVPATATATASTSTAAAAAASASASAAPAATYENEPVRLLLEQLTDLHDSLQRERTVRWNEFLRKVRAERRKEGEAAAAAAAAAGGSGGAGGKGGGGGGGKGAGKAGGKGGGAGGADGSTDRSIKPVDMPEVSLVDGEVVGIAGLGNKGKVGRAKWREFRSLVLGGVPVGLRAKVWSECSGASSMRVPGYYDDLVKGIGGSEPESSVVAQIDMDIRRTLTDNVFFRKGPGVSKLREVLVAYSRRNPEVGYCQGMNLIAGSLLLITPTAEDAFWILASMIEVILPQHYYDHGLMASRADQVVLRGYISQVLPKLSAHLDALGIELEALTFQWFLSVFTDCLSAEALYRVWDVVLCLNVTSTSNTDAAPTSRESNTNNNSNDPSDAFVEDAASGNGGGSTFLFRVALALLKLNEHQLLTTCLTPAALYTYINHQMTNHAISIDGLIQASEGLKKVVRREDVVARRAVALKEMQ